MQILSQMDPRLHAEVRRRQANAWSELIAALEDTWTCWLASRWRPDARISPDEVWADLDYGRD